MASVFYLALALDGIWNWRRTEDLLILNIWASHLFIVDAVCALIVWRLGVIRGRGTKEQVLTSVNLNELSFCWFVLGVT